MSTITIALPDEDLDFLRAYSQERGTSVEAFLAQQARSLREHLEALHALPSDSHRAVLSYTSFLQYQEEARLAEASEAEWDRLSSQPEKMAKFADWARESLVQHPPELFDHSRL